LVVTQLTSATSKSSPPAEPSHANAVNPTLPAFEQGAWSPSQASHVHHPSIAGMKRNFELVVAAPRTVDKIPTTTIDPAYVPKSSISEESLSFPAGNAPAGTKIGTNTDIDVDSHCMCRRGRTCWSKKQHNDKAEQSNGYATHILLRDSSFAL
jgi:hypothetical protein